LVTMKPTARELIDFRVSEARVGAEIDARDLAPVTRHDRVEHFLPAVRAVHVAGTQSAALQTADDSRLQT
jgi:hypothetical protein